jgi:hypothetical protein
MTPLTCITAKYQFETRMTRLSEYGQTLERLLASEFASVYTREALSEIAQKARGDDYVDDEPSEELTSLRDDFPSILRGSLFVYAVATFENQARAYVNAKLEKKVIAKGANLKQIATTLASEIPAAVDAPTTKQLERYKHLRDACAHAGGYVSSVLHELLKVSDAAQHLPGVVFRPYAEKGTPSSTFTEQQLALGTVELTSEFIPESVAFFRKQFSRITK